MFLLNRTDTQASPSIHESWTKTDTPREDALPPCFLSWCETGTNLHWETAGRASLRLFQYIFVQPYFAQHVALSPSALNLGLIEVSICCSYSVACLRARSRRRSCNQMTRPSGPGLICRPADQYEVKFLSYPVVGLRMSSAEDVSGPTFERRVKLMRQHLHWPPNPLHPNVDVWLLFDLMFLYFLHDSDIVFVFSARQWFRVFIF